METLIIALILVVLVGAILGGKSFGGTVRKGCGFFILLGLGIAALVLIFAITSDVGEDSDESENQKSVSSAYFIVDDECPVYAKPDVQSEISDTLEMGKEYFVNDLNKYNYFYKISDQDGESFYVRKECLKKKY